jgi:DNA-binding response OmpR family regulator
MQAQRRVGRSMKIALLEDDEHQARLLQLWLQQIGYDCETFGTGQEFMRTVGRESFDVHIIDWMLPDTNGIEVLKWVREQKGSTVPILFVTSRDEEDDIVTALQEGADEYITKPVTEKEFLARFNALIRRTIPQSDNEKHLTFGNYDVDCIGRNIKSGDDTIDLTNKEFELALFLFRNIGRILSRGYILETVWGRSAKINTRTVDTHISRLRNKLNLNPDAGWKLSAIYQHGYRLEHLSDDSAHTDKQDKVIVH